MALAPKSGGVSTLIFRSSEWQMLKQIGNAVPPLLGHAAGCMVYGLISATYVKKEKEDETSTATPIAAE